MQKVSPFLWFDDQAEYAANYYVSIFRNSAILDVARYGEGAPRPAGGAMSVSFVLDGLEFQALNGGPQFQFTEAISLYVRAETQDEMRVGNAAHLRFETLTTGRGYLTSRPWGPMRA